LAAQDALRSIKVGDVMRKEFESIRLDEPLSKAIGKLEDGWDVLVVLDERGEYAGVLTEKMILRTLADPSTTKVRSVYRRAPSVSPDEGVLRAAMLMVENDLRYLPVISDGAIAGVVGDEAILAVAVKTPFGNLKVSELMIPNPVSVGVDDSVARALAIMRREGISRLPVLRGDRVVGVLSLRDIVEKVLRPRAGIGEGERRPPSRRVGDLMSGDVVSVSPDDEVRKAVELMMKRDVASVIVAEGGALRGLLTRSGVLRELVRIEAEAPRMVVQFSVKDPEEFENIEFDREKLNSMIDGFLRKYGKFLGSSYVTVYIRRGKGRKRGRRLTHCRIQVSGPKGMFTGVGEGWGLNQAVRYAMDAVSRQIERAKEGKEADRAIVEEILEML